LVGLSEKKKSKKKREDKWFQAQFRIEAGGLTGEERDLSRGGGNPTKYASRYTKKLRERGASQSKGTWVSTYIHTAGR